jgi:hypothetical protein
MAAPTTAPKAAPKWYFNTTGVIGGFNKSVDDRETEP